MIPTAATLCASARSRKCPTGLLLLWLALELAMPFTSHAQVTSSIVSDGTMGTTVGHIANQYNINGGTIRGANQFHSFDTFTVGTGDIASFNGPSGIVNILSRVTGLQSGLQQSLIDGTIQSTIPGANLFLMNPAGIIFGPSAVVNVGGVAHFTTGDYLRLADGVLFNAIPNATADALLSAAPVAAFGFLGSDPGAIAVEGSQLTVADGTGISLIGGNITIQSGAPGGGTAQPARLSAPNGKIQLATAASPGEFDAATLQALPNVDGASFAAFGSMMLAPGSNINVSGTNTVSIRGGQFVLSVNDAVLSTAASPGQSETISLGPNSLIISSNLGTAPGADIQMAADNLLLDGVSIQSRTTGAGSGGNISINAQAVTLTNGAQIVSSASGAGDGGNITLSATDSIFISGYDTTGTLSGLTPFYFDPNTGLPLVTSGLITATSGSGAGGSVTINSGIATIDNAATLATLTSGDGRGGDLTLNVRNLTIQNAGFLYSSAGFDLSTFEVTGTGRGGDITISAQDSIRISGFNPNFFLTGGIYSTSANTGDGGNIALSARYVSVENGGLIATIGGGSGNAGSIAILADHLLVTGVDDIGNQSQLTSQASPSSSGTINITAQSVEVSDFGTVYTVGNGGNITIQAGQSVNVMGVGNISTTGGESSSGDITIAADRVLVSGQNELSQSGIRTTATSGEPAVGKINLNVRELVVTDGGRIDTETSLGNALGGIYVTATEAVTVSAEGKIRMGSSAGPAGPMVITSPSITLDQGILQTYSTSGNAGSVTLNTDTLTLAGGFINSAVTQAVPGRGGNITINASDKVLISGQFNGNLVGDNPRPAGIYSDTAGTLPGGDISVTAGNLISISGSRVGLYSQSNGSTGDGGTISVRAPQVQLLDGAMISAKTIGAGNAGNIFVNANAFSMNGGSTITTTSTGSGAAGKVTIEGTASPAQSVLIDGTGSGIFTETQGTGKGGDIVVNANSVTLQNGGTLSAKTSGTETTATGGTITVTAGQMAMNNQALVTAETNGIAPAGTVEINTGSLAMSSGSQIRSSSGSAVPPVALALAAPLTGGTVTVQGQTGAGSLANSVSINGTNSGIFTNTEGTRPGGDLNISAQSVSISNGALVTAGTTGSGTGGAITINAGSTFAASAGTVSSTATQAQGGDITITAGNSVTLSSNSLITATSTGPGNAGNILINAGQNYTSTNSKVTTQATAPGTDASGGNITVLATDTVSLTDSQLNASVQGSTTTVGGNIVIDPQFVILQNSQILAQATQGQGGNITITTNVFLPDSVSIVDASSQLGVNGTVNIQSPRNQTGGLLVPLPKNALEATTWINSRCRALAGGEASSFILAGHESLPTEPAGWLSSPVTGLTGEPVLSAQFVPFPEQRSASTQEDTVSLRRLTPPGFLLQAFAADPTDCAS